MLPSIITYVRATHTTVAYLQQGYGLYIADNIRNLWPYVSFTGFAFYLTVRCGFDKHLYLKSCLNAHNHNTCIRLPQTGCTARKMALFIISQDRQTQVLAANAMAITIIHDFRYNFHRQSGTLLLLVIILRTI